MHCARAYRSNYKFAGAFGGMLGSLYATNIGGHQPLGFAGWRFAFLTVACVSALIGVATLLAADDPRCSKHWSLRCAATLPLGAVSVIRGLLSCLLVFGSPDESAAAHFSYWCQ